MASIDVVDSFGATSGVQRQLIREEVDLICSMYATAPGDTPAKLDSECEERAKERYLATAYLMSSYCRCYGQLLDNIENNYSRGNE